MDGQHHTCRDLFAYMPQNFGALLPRMFCCSILYTLGTEDPNGGMSRSSHNANMLDRMFSLILSILIVREFPQYMEMQPSPGHLINSRENI
jgi:hypothetical protein